MTKKQERRQIKHVLKTSYPSLSCRWLKKLSHQEIHDLWIAIMSLNEDESMIRF